MADSGRSKPFLLIRLNMNRREISFKNRFARCIWNFAWFVFYRPTPRNFHSWRRMLLRLFGAKIAHGAHPYPSARIWAPWNLVMMEGSCISEAVDCYCVDKITIGKNATVSQYSYLCTASHSYNDCDIFKSPVMPLVGAPIVISDYAWVAADVFIGPGVKVGEGAVVAARSTIIRDVEPWSVEAGNPPRVIGRRRSMKISTDSPAEAATGK
jgi:putative colanic acid biosynthesis acetyltransferase WcaF